MSIAITWPAYWTLCTVVKSMWNTRIYRNSSKLPKLCKSRDYTQRHVQTIFPQHSHQLAHLEDEWNILSYNLNFLFFLIDTQSTAETEDSRYDNRNSMREPINYNSNPQNLNNNSNNINNNNSSNHNLNIPSPTPNRSTFREHIRAKNPYQDLINSSSNNNNNNSSTNNNLTNNNSSLNNNNNNANSTNQNLSPKYAIQQTNSSSKILDNQKYHKYFSKRKMMAQYELEMRNEKKSKMSMSTPPPAHQPQDEPVALFVKRELPPPQTEPEELTVNETNNNSSTTANNNTINSSNISTNSNSNGSSNNSINSSSDVQNIKVEPDLVQRGGSGVIATVATTAVNDDDDDDDSSNSEYFLADLRKRKHSTSAIEQTLALTTKKEASTACSWALERNWETN